MLRNCTYLIYDCGGMLLVLLLLAASLLRVVTRLSWSLLRCRVCCCAVAVLLLLLLGVCSLLPKVLDLLFPSSAFRAFRCFGSTHIMFFVHHVAGDNFSVTAIALIPGIYVYVYALLWRSGRPFTFVVVISKENTWFRFSCTHMYISHF